MRSNGVRRVNAYICDNCGLPTVTVDRITGTTPFMIDCAATQGCNGSSYSMFYPPQVEKRYGKPTREFYKPRGEELQRLKFSDPYTYEYIRQGGLLLRPLENK